MVKQINENKGRETRASDAAKIKVEAVVLGGLLDPCGNIGTHLRFWLLPVPWEKEHFVEKITGLIQFEFEQKAIIEHQKTIFPEDPNDDLALARGVGVCVWLVSGKDAQPLLDTLQADRENTWPPKRWKAALRLVDSLEYVPSLDYKWLSNDPHDELCIDEIEHLIQAEIHREPKWPIR